MTLSDFRRITDELLSAYIDDEVTEQERALIEAALAQDEEIAWRLNALRQTVTLLRDLPELALPRSFTLTLDQVAQSNEPIASVGAMERQPVATPAASPRLQRQIAPEAQAGFWGEVAEGWRRFWQGGNPILRNAAAVSFALMLFLAGGGQLLNRALTQPVGMMATAPEAAPAASEAMPATQAVAIAPTATELSATESRVTEAESQSAQEDSSLKAPVADAPAEESARILQAPAEEASDAPPATTAEAPAAASAARSSESTDAEDAEEDAAEEDADSSEGEAAIAEAPTAPASDDAAEQEEPSVAAAMTVPEQPQGDAMPPMVANPIPGGGAGGGRPESGGGGPIGAGGDETGGLVPEEAHGFTVNPVGGPTPLPAEQGVTASVAAASAAGAPAASAADVAVTPAVDAVPEAEIAAASVASEPVASEVVTSEVATSEPVTTTMPVTATPVLTEPVAAEAYTEPTPKATVEPTPEAVALVAPEAITSSEIVENVEMEGATPATGPAGNVPVVWVAQGSAFLLTIVLASLWWRSRTPRRPRGS